MPAKISQHLLHTFNKAEGERGNVLLFAVRECCHGPWKSRLCPFGDQPSFGRDNGCAARGKPQIPDWQTASAALLEPCHALQLWSKKQTELEAVRH